MFPLFGLLHSYQERDLNIELYRISNHTDRYHIFGSRHPLKHTLGVFRTIPDR